MPISLGFRQFSIFRFRSSSALILPGERSEVKHGAGSWVNPWKRSAVDPWGRSEVNLGGSKVNPWSVPQPLLAFGRLKGIQFSQNMSTENIPNLAPNI